MLILISDADKAGKRQVTVTDDGAEIFSASVADLAEAHKVIKAARKNAWATPDAKVK